MQMNGREKNLERKIAIFPSMVGNFFFRQEKKYFFGCNAINKCDR